MEKLLMCKLGRGLKTVEINTENTRFNRNVIWEKLKLDDMLGIVESLKTNPCKYPRCKNENVKTRRHAHRPGECQHLGTFSMATQDGLAWL